MKGGGTDSVVESQVQKHLLGVQGVGGNVGESTTVKIGVLAIVFLGFLADLLEVALNSGILVPSTREDGGETAGRGIPGNLGHHIGSTADSSHVWASGGEDRLELGGLAIARLASRAHTFNGQKSQNPEV